MSKGIIEIDMPKKCDECPIRQSNLAYCLIAKKSTSHHPGGKPLDESKRPNWCPIKARPDRWIPVSERLPELNTWILVSWHKNYYRENYTEHMISIASRTREGYLTSAGLINGEIDAWMSLPELYKEDEQDE